MGMPKIASPPSHWVADQPIEREPFVGNDVRHRLAEDGEHQKHAGDDDQRQADAAPDRFQKQQHADAAEDRFERKIEDDAEPGYGVDENRAGAFGQSGITEEHVKRTGRSEQAEHDVVDGKRPRAQVAGRRKQEKAEDQAEGQVDAARRNIDDYSKFSRNGSGDAIQS